MYFSGGAASQQTPYPIQPTAATNPPPPQYSSPYMAGGPRAPTLPYQPQPPPPVQPMKTLWRYNPTPNVLPGQNLGPPTGQAMGQQPISSTSQVIFLIR